MFSLETKMVKIAKLDIHNDKDANGEEHSACDITVAAPMENTVLDHFNPLMKSAFYAGDGQTDMVSGERLTLLKFPMPKFPMKGNLEGYTFFAHVGAGGPSEVKLTSAVVNKVHFLLKDKGAVDMDFIVRARTHPDDIAKLSRLLGKEVQISLVPPDEKQQFELAQKKKNGKKALDDHFTGKSQAPVDGGGQDPEDDDPHTNDLSLESAESVQNSDDNQDPDFREVGAQGDQQYQVE